jgi:hypothetical protein
MKGVIALLQEQRELLGLVPYRHPRGRMGLYKTPENFNHNKDFQNEVFKEAMYSNY